MTDQPLTPVVTPSAAAGSGIPLIPVVPTAGATASGTDEAAGSTFYEQLGGRPTFERLVREFYRGVAADPVLVAMYPEEDLEGAIQRLTGFLEQYWGGPTTYSQERGHPRLRMRHNPFKVNPDARDRWLLHMRAAVDSLELAPLQDATLWDYLERAAHAMVNTFDE
ncbi:globin [Subtercola boreus]|uniref:Globin n=1 Tax=Subtercola boreus TaxID=120213 RepID=A0A3E0W0W4_9MICO|nr:globin [Subtercola boreus]